MNKYYVYSTNNKNDEEFLLLKTDSKDEAIERARDEKYYIERDNRKDSVEIRQYVEDIEDEDCTCFDYNTIEF